MFGSKPAKEKINEKEKVDVTESAEFKNAAGEVSNLAAKPNQTELSEIYGLYKVGNGYTKRDPNQIPSLVDWLNRGKHVAWGEALAKSNDDPVEAQKLYVARVEELKQKYGMK